MPTKVFVGRIAEGTSGDDIKALFRKFGTVTECDVISNYGFVVSRPNIHLSLLILSCLLHISCI